MGEDDHGGSGVGSSDADVVQSSVDAQGDAAGVIDSVAANSFVGVGVSGAGRGRFRELNRPGLGGTQRLPRAVGKYKAADLVLTGRTLSADEAERTGLVSRVVPAAELLAEANDVAVIIASRSLPAVLLAKQALQAAQETDLAEGMRAEKQAFAATFALEDRAEGMTAFLEKREAHFAHR